MLDDELGWRMNNTGGFRHGVLPSQFSVSTFHALACSVIRPGRGTIPQLSSFFRLQLKSQNQVRVSGLDAKAKYRRFRNQESEVYTTENEDGHGGFGNLSLQQISSNQEVEDSVSHPEMQKGLALLHILN